MINIGNFYALARVQLDRANGALCKDQALITTVPARYHPTKQSKQRTIMDTLVPPAQHFRFAAACAWFGFEQVELLVDVYENDEDMNARGKLVMVGAITAPNDAPCWEYPWDPTIIRRLTYERRHGTLVHGRWVDVFGEYTMQFMADVRHQLTDSWVDVSGDVGLGLGWVFDGSDDPAGTETAPLVISKILEEQSMHWPGPNLVPAWTVDSVAAWAEVCTQYVRIRRGK